MADIWGSSERPLEGLPGNVQALGPNRCYHPLPGNSRVLPWVSGGGESTPWCRLWSPCPKDEEKVLCLISELQKRPTCQGNKVGTLGLPYSLTRHGDEETRVYLVLAASAAPGHVTYTKITVLQRAFCPVKVSFNLEERASHPTGCPPW